jgi:glucosamine--fructose-6-phosphate aminotransferase (isomerizing)
MSAEIRQQFLTLPRALRETVEKGWSEYIALVRRTRWGEVPIHIVGAGASFSVGLAGAYSFESLLGWPAAVRTPEEFQAYSQSALRPRSILIVISWEGSVGLLELVRASKARGATVLALTGDAQSPLAKAVDGVLLARGGEEHRDPFTAAVCQLAALQGLVGLMARALKRPSPHIETLEAELRALPEHIDWVLTQLPDAVRSLAGELSRVGAVSVLAGGLYNPAALLAASGLRSLGQMCVEVFTPNELETCPTEVFEREGVVLVLSGSRCRVKKRIHDLIERSHRAGVKILAVTDHNEPEVTRRATLAILLPNLSEYVGSIVALTFVDWAVYHLASLRSRNERRPRGA